MLSSQTKDEVVDAAVITLREAVGGILSVDAIINAEDSVIKEAIKKVGFSNKKTMCVLVFPYTTPFTFILDTLRALPKSSRTILTPTSPKP